VVDITAESITEGLLTCLENREESKKTGDHARQFIFENYTWHKLAYSLENFYQKLIKSAKPNLFT